MTKPTASSTVTVTKKTAPATVTKPTAPATVTKTTDIDVSQTGGRTAPATQRQIGPTAPTAQTDPPAPVRDAPLTLHLSTEMVDELVNPDVAEVIPISEVENFLSRLEKEAGFERNFEATLNAIMSVDTQTMERKKKNKKKFKPWQTQNTYKLRSYGNKEKRKRAENRKRE